MTNRLALLAVALALLVVFFSVVMDDGRAKHAEWVKENCTLGKTVKPGCGVNTLE